MEEDTIIPGWSGAAAYCGDLHKTTVQRWANTGDFPAPIRLGPRKVGWRRSTLDAWLADRPQEVRTMSDEHRAAVAAGRGLAKRRQTEV
jgi:predicted DNA-binding transcriptional regulator AlpA